MLTYHKLSAMVSCISNEPINKQKIKSGKERIIERSIKSGKINLYTDCRNDRKWYSPGYHSGRRTCAKYQWACKDLYDQPGHGCKGN